MRKTNMNDLEGVPSQGNDIMFSLKSIITWPFILMLVRGALSVINFKKGFSDEWNIFSWFQAVTVINY